MLTKFEVTNFKSFDKKITLDFKNTNGYQFNAECVENNIVKKALVYGHNGIGKSNLGLAIFDIVSHLTDKNHRPEEYKNYLNADSNTPDFATFAYEFEFPEGKVRYEYTKTNIETLLSEEILINDSLYAKIDRSQTPIATIQAPGAENLLTDLGDSIISLLSYIKNNSVLEKNNKHNICFKKLMEFVNEMLFFRSVQFEIYIGFKQGEFSVGPDIIKRENLKDYESFLNEAGINCKLTTIAHKETNSIAFKFKEKTIPYSEIMSQGTKALTLFYFWFQTLKDDKAPKFIFIDEFDAFYHHSLSELIVKKLKEVDAQVILTSHNTSIITNELLRPDCYFILDPEGIQSLAHCTSKDLREAHNIEKMYRAGAFGG
ncbi:MAG: AAA15 family ATPase/GTPase [Desulforhopalus sp.]|jgi:AAA15 family ATPase/GTPase